MQVPAPFEYWRATSIDHAIELLAEHDEARVIAGGHSLLPMMKLRLAVPEHLVDINDLSDDLSYIRQQDGELRIGALTRHRQLLQSDELAEAFPLFRDAEQVIADPVVRNRGTIGGSLCQADPSEDLSAVVTTLEGACVIRGADGERVVDMHDFHRGPWETAVGEAELLTEIRIPVRPNGGSAYEKVERRAGDWAVVSAGAAVWMDGDSIDEGRVGLAAVGPNTTAIGDCADALRGATPSDQLFDEVGGIAAANCQPTTDQRGTAAYKRHLAHQLTVRALRRAIERAGAPVTA